jgi:hypothetical protein
VRVELSKPAPVEILKIGVGPRERQINVIEHTCVARTRLVRGAGHQPLGECCNRRGIVMVEERSMLCAAGMLLGVDRSITLHMLFKLGVRVGYESGPRNGPRANRRSNQECAASRIMFCHVEFPPLRDESGYPSQY